MTSFVNPGVGVGVGWGGGLKWERVQGGDSRCGATDDVSLCAKLAHIKHVVVKIFSLFSCFVRF